MNRSIEETEQFIIILENEAGTTDQ
jgi:hypothetical protein